MFELIYGRGFQTSRNFKISTYQVAFIDVKKSQKQVAKTHFWAPTYRLEDLCFIALNMCLQTFS